MEIPDQSKTGAVGNTKSWSPVSGVKGAFASLKFSVYKLSVKRSKWAGEMAEWLRVHTTLTEDPSAIPGIHIEQLTTTRNSSARGILYFWSLWAVAFLHVQTHSHNLKQPNKYERTE